LAEAGHIVVWIVFSTNLIALAQCCLRGLLITNLESCELLVPLIGIGCNTYTVALRGPSPVACWSSPSEGNHRRCRSRSASMKEEVG
jgi:hypothetical protein